MKGDKAMKTLIKPLILFTLAVAIPALSACHTIQGAGKDITAVGKGMEDATK
jgi:predicted small secreted protein